MPGADPPVPTVVQIGGLKGDEPFKPFTMVHISDTHNRTDLALEGCPPGDVLVHTGDFSNRGDREELKEFVRHLHKFPHPHKIVISGNHEYKVPGYGPSNTQEALNYRGWMDKEEQSTADSRYPVIYLEDSSCHVMGVKFYGSPWNGSRNQGFGKKEKDRAERWGAIPGDTDVLLTHIPPFPILDMAWVSTECDDYCDICKRSHTNYSHWGCRSLRRRVDGLGVPLHCFGHVHTQTGVRQVGGTIFSNASFDNELHRATQVFEVRVPAGRDAGMLIPCYKPTPEIRKPYAIDGLQCYIRNLKTRSVLDVNRASTEPGTAVIGYRNTGKAHQKFRFDGGVVIACCNGLALDANTQDGLNLIVYNPTRRRNQRISYCEEDRTLRLDMKGQDGSTLALTETVGEGKMGFQALLQEGPRREQQWALIPV